MIRVLVLCPHPDDATSFYRGVGPLTRLAKAFPKEISLIFVTEVKWSTALVADLVFMQRPFLPVHVQAMQITKNCNLPLWVDFDDDLFSVQQDNPTFPVYGLESTKKQVATIAAAADMISVSTETLKTKLAGLNKNIRVVPNAFDEKLFKVGERIVPRRKIVLWRGSNTHQKDLMTITPEVVDASNNEKHKEWVFHFVGYNPWWMTERMPHERTVISPAIDILEYFKFLNTCSPAASIVPLIDSPFNKSKSNIAWIESSYAGAVVIAPDLAEFMQPGVLNYNSPEGFGVALDAVMRGDIDVLAQNKLSWDHIQAELTLSKVNRLRREIVEQLV